jgi:hypothetical protein
VNWFRVEELLKACEKGAAAESVPAIVPSGHAELLKHYDGIEGFVADEHYLIIWRAREIEELNVAYSVARYLPGVVLIGTDGGDTGFGVDADGAYVSVPLIGMSPKEAKTLGTSFDAFLEHVASGDVY